MAVRKLSRAFEPSPLLDLSEVKERERLSASALKAFFALIDAWGLKDDDARRLLGGISNGAYYALKRQPDRTLDQDRLARISFLIGIFKALNILHSQRLADAWVQRPNTNPMFGGGTPLAYMIKGGIPAMQNVRRLLDARRGG